jgi:toxin FitB
MTACRPGLLDTNVIDNTTKPSSSESLPAGMAEQNDDDLCISSPTVAEIRRGGVAETRR